MYADRQDEMPDEGSAQQGALGDIVVIDASTWGASPWVATRLSDFGAEVIKVELPEVGDSTRASGTPHPDPALKTSLFWKVEGRNKRCITLDLRRPEGRDILKRLAANADVVLENFRPGTMERWGLGPDDLFDVNPRLVYVRTTGWGQESPYSQRAAFGTLIEAMCFAHLNGEPDGPPTLPPMSLGDMVASVVGTVGVLVALRERDRSGHGQVVDNSIFDSVLSSPTGWLQFPQYVYSGKVMSRTGNGSSGNVTLAPRGMYPTRDGKWIAVAGSTDATALRVLRSLHPEFDIAAEERFATNELRVANRAELDELIAGWISGRTAAECMERFITNDAPAALVHSVEDHMNDPHVLGRINWFEDDQFGRIPIHEPVPRLGRTPGEVRFLGRGLGEDNRAILCGRLGLSESELSDLADKGVV